MSSAPTADEIARDATWLPQALDAQQGVVRLVKLDGGGYRAAGFLDDRMFAEPRDSLVLPWLDVAAAAAEVRAKATRWIFHISHVGSTLVARLLGEIDGVLSIREPRILRDLAMLPAQQRADYLEPVQKLLSRTFAPDQLPLVKATSFVSEIAPELVGPGERALFMYASPRNYVASILAGPNSVQELAALAPSRAQRVSGRAALPQPATTAGSAACAWACEMTALEAAAEAMAESRVEWVDFDRMLADMPGQLSHLAGFFGFATQQTGEIARGPLMQRYSKALEYEYTPSLRRDLIAEASASNRADIDSAIAMLQSAASTSPLLERALRRAECIEPSNS